jgi:hypothetical protein
MHRCDYIDLLCAKLAHDRDKYTQNEDMFSPHDNDVRANPETWHHEKMITLHPGVYTTHQEDMCHGQTNRKLSPKI